MANDIYNIEAADIENGIDFQTCGYADDFEALIDVSNFIPSIPECTFDIWLKAYDTSCCETDREKSLHDSGYKYECCICVQNYDGYIIGKMASREARDEDEAEQTLIEMAHDMMRDEKLVSAMKDGIDSCMTVMNI